MEAVIDSSALIFSLKIPDFIPLLKANFQVVFVPEAVYAEVVATGKNIGAPEVHCIVEWFERKWLQRARQSPLSASSLGAGEAEALAIAQRKGIVCISDDRKAYQIGSVLGIEVVSLPALVIAGVRKKQLSKEKARSLIDSLVGKGYYLRPADYLAILKAVE